jgi:hypothetical protein
MKRFVLTLLSFLCACAAFAQVPPQPKSPLGVVDAFFEIRDRAPDVVMRLGTFVQLARQCGIPDSQLKGAQTHYEVYASLGDAQYKQGLVAAYARGVQRASRNPLSTSECRSRRVQMQRADEFHAEGARKLAGLVTHAQAIGGIPIELPPDNPISVPPGQQAPDPSEARRVVPIGPALR